MMKKLKAFVRYVTSFFKPVKTGHYAVDTKIPPATAAAAKTMLEKQLKPKKHVE